MFTQAIDWDKTPYLYINYSYSEDEGDGESSTVENSDIINCHPAIFFLNEKAKEKEWKTWGYQLLAMVPMTKDEYQKYMSDKSIIENKLH